MKFFFESDEPYEIDCALNWRHYWRAICDARQYIRNKLKYCRISKTTERELEAVREFLFDVPEPRDG